MIISPVRIEDLARSALDVDADLREPKWHVPPPVVLAAVVAAWRVYYKALRMLIATLSPMYFRSASAHPESSGFEAIRELLARRPINRHQRRAPAPALLLRAFCKVEEAAASDRFIQEAILGYHGKVLRLAFERLATKALPARRSQGL